MDATIVFQNGMYLLYIRRKFMGRIVDTGPGHWKLHTGKWIAQRDLRVTQR